MIAFITSLRHPQNSADYSRVERLLSATLDSVSQQSDDNFVVIIVGNRPPRFPLPRNTQFVQVDFEAPAPPNGPSTAREPFVRDKGTKISVGLIAARQYDPDYVMIFDADDFVHGDIAQFVNSQPEHAGWVIERGWVYSNTREGYRRQNQFNRTCGTSFVVPYSAYNVPAHLTVHSSQEELLEAFGDTLLRIIGAHRDAVEWHRERGRILEPFPFRAAVYHVDTGENHSGKDLPGIIRPIDKKFARIYGIRTRVSILRRAWMCVGPRAVTESAASGAHTLARNGYQLLLRIVTRSRRTSV